MPEIASRISVDPSVRFGKPVITGTRVPVEIIVGKVASGMSLEEIATEYMIAREDITAALSYAAQIVAGERILPS